MSSKLNLALRRLVKVAAVALVSALIGWLSGPEVAGIVGQQGAVLIAGILVPVLSGLEKAYFPLTS